MSFLVNPYIAGGGGYPPLPLDALRSDVGAAFSRRRIFSLYRGSSWRAKKISAGTEQDIGFSGDGPDDAGAASFASGANTGVTVAYDQGPNGLDAAVNITGTLNNLVVTSGGSTYPGWRMPYASNTGVSGHNNIALHIPLSWATGVSSGHVFALILRPDANNGGGYALSSYSSVATAHPWNSGSFVESFLTSTAPSVGSGVSTSNGAYHLVSTANTGSALRSWYDAVSIGSDVSVSLTTPTHSFFPCTSVGAVEIAEIIIFRRILTTTERQLVEGDIMWSWGKQASLPSGHPYKSAAPTAFTRAPGVLIRPSIWLPRRRAIVRPGKRAA